MMRPLGLAALLVALASTTTLAAEAHTYVGTLGGAEIVLELTAPEDGPILARFTRHALGIDVPLAPVDDTGPLVLSEPLSNGTAALWTIEGAIGDADLDGTWQASGREAHDLSLTLIGARPYERDPHEPYEVFSRVPDGPIAWNTTPYEAAKMRGHYDGEPWSRSGGLYHMVSDPRTEFTFPRVLSLHDGTDPGPINDFLRREHWRIGIEALECLAETGSLGGYDEQFVTVHQLSTRIMSMTRSAMITCGGPSISIDEDHLNLDVVAGTPLDMSRVFSGWDNGPSPSLADYVRAHMDEDYWQDGECDPGADLPQHLAVTFADAEPPAVAFHLIGMSPPCNDRVLTRMITDLAPFLAEGALDLVAG